jgi:hypothetical protein
MQEAAMLTEIMQVLSEPEKYVVNVRGGEIYIETVLDAAIAMLA